MEPMGSILRIKSFLRSLLLSPLFALLRLLNPQSRGLDFYLGTQMAERPCEETKFGSEEIQSSTIYLTFNRPQVNDCVRPLFLFVPSHVTNTDRDIDSLTYS